MLLLYAARDNNRIANNGEIYHQVLFSKCLLRYKSHHFGFDAMNIWQFTPDELVELSMLMLLSNARIRLIISVPNPDGEHPHRELLLHNSTNQCATCSPHFSNELLHR